MSFRYQRERVNMSQKEVAERLGVDQSAVSQWEKGKTLPRGKTLKNLAALYGCSVDDLLSENSA